MENFIVAKATDPELSCLICEEELSPAKPFIETPLGIATISGVIIAVVAMAMILKRRGIPK